MNKIIALFTIFAVLIGCVFCRVEDDETSIKLHFYDGSSKWWIAVDPRDDSFETVSVEVREASDSQWTPMMYNPGWPYFHLPSTSGRGFALPLSFRLTSANGEEVIALVYRIGSNLLVDTKEQYKGSTEAPTEEPTIPPTPVPTEPSTPSPTEPSTPAPTEPSTPAPTEPATPAPTEPSTPAPTEPATPAPTEPATPAPTQPATPAPTEPATPAPTQPATPAPTEPATPAPTQPATPAPTEPATPAPTQPATPAPTQPATPAPTQPATPAPTQPATPAPTQPATSAPTQPATPAPTPKATVPPTAAPTTRPTVTPTQPATPAPTQPATPAPTPKATPAPTQPATPAPTPKATPAPTQPATPAPTPKATPAPTQPATPAPTPKPTTTPAPTQPSVDACALVPVKTEPLKILIPLYVYPGAAWDTIIAAAQTGVKIIAIINPNSGPNYNGPDASYTKYMKKFQDAGIEMVGYVHTSWGARSINTVNTEIGIYASKYPGVSGIFFDEAATEANQVPYYRTAYNTVLSKGFVHSILNPGVQPDKQYIDIASNIVIFENYASELSRAGYSNWVKCAPTSAQKSGYKYKFSAIIHTASQSNMGALIQRTHDLGMGLIYITDGPGGCCTYNYLNTYFTAQAAAVKAFNS